LEEAQSLANEVGRTAHLEEALVRAQTHLASAQARAEEAQARGVDVDEVLALLAENSVRLQENLAEVYEKVPEQAQPAIERAMEATQRGFTEAAGAVSNQKRESLLEDSLSRRQQVLFRTKNERVFLRIRLAGWRMLERGWRSRVWSCLRLKSQKLSRE